MSHNSLSPALSSHEISLALKEEDLITKLQRFTVVKRNGSLVPFRLERIRLAVVAAFQDTKKTGKEKPLAQEWDLEVDKTLSLVIVELYNVVSNGSPLTVEGIQDLVEMCLMQKGHADVARDYMVYRDQHKVQREDSPLNLKITRSDLSVAKFNPMKIAEAIEKAFRSAEQVEGPTKGSLVETINTLTQRVVEGVLSLAKEGQTLTSHLVDEEIEKLLMREGFFGAAKNFILHKSKGEEEKRAPREERSFLVIGKDKTQRVLTAAYFLSYFEFACRGLEEVTSPASLLEELLPHLHDGISEEEIRRAAIRVTRERVLLEPDYLRVTTRLLLDLIYTQTVGVGAEKMEFEEAYRAHFKSYLSEGVKLELLDPHLLDFDLGKLSEALVINRDEALSYLGLQTLFDHFFLRHEGRCVELPQIFWMRVAMGLALNEGEKKTDRAIEFYTLLSSLLFCLGAPTLLNAGTTHPQLSSSYLSTTGDDLSHIFKVISDNVLLSRWGGGLGNDWTEVRASGAAIKGSGGKSPGIIPFLKVVDHTASTAIQRGGRQGAVCASLEMWHLDIEEFLLLRKDTEEKRGLLWGMATSSWVPDLFMKRVKEGKEWTLFSPDDVPELHELYGKAFENRYLAYEMEVKEGKIALFKRVEALQLWRKMLTMLFETGHPWIAFKDPANIRSAQDHKGVIHNSSLGTEALLNTSEEESAVCNLGSINLSEHVTEEGLNEEKLEETIRTAMRILDNLIDVTSYPTKEARLSNLCHRPAGLGILGFQEALYAMKISYSSHEAVRFADVSMEKISYLALTASSELAQERGSYPSFKGSKWDRDLLPLDTIALLEEERGGDLEMDRSSTLDWSPVRRAIKEKGLRHAQLLAVAPTSHTSLIAGCTPSIEPALKHLMSYSSSLGEYLLPNPSLVFQLKHLGLWDQQMVSDLKYFDGSAAEILRIPEEIKALFLTAFEIDPEWTIECTSRRQKWVDMGLAHSFYLAEPSLKKLNHLYQLAWRKGLKTTYHLRFSL